MATHDADSRVNLIRQPDSNLGWWALGLVMVCALVVAGLASWAGCLDRVYRASEGLPAAAAHSPGQPVNK
jgi:hypothetical protein